MSRLAHQPVRRGFAVSSAGAASAAGGGGSGCGSGVGVTAGSLALNDGGARFTFRFCPVCGTTLFHTEEGREARSVAVAVGAFGDPAFPPPTVSVYECRRHSWVQLPEGIRRHDKDPA